MTQRLVPDTRVEEAEWYSAALAGFGGRVECVVPRGYPAYARILHRAGRPSSGSVRWAEVAAKTGTVLHPLAQFASLAGRWEYERRVGLGWPGSNPDEGTLDVEQLRALCRILARHTTSAEHCWLTVWEGWGNLPSAWPRSYPRIRQPHRAYFLFHRPLDDVVDFSIAIDSLHEEFSTSARYLVSTSSSAAAADAVVAPAGARPVRLQSPSQWWPADRAWAVATEIDFDSTLVAGSDALVQEIVDDTGLEAFRVESADDLTTAGDTVNPGPAY